MEAGKLKTIVILILLCVNLAFGGILLAERMDTAVGAAQSRSELAEVMAGLGITLDPEIIPAEAPALRYSVSRDPEAEEKLVTALLGEVVGEDQGGNIRLYENENGWARFRSGGSFEVSLKVAGSSLDSRLRESGLNIVRDEESYVCATGEARIFNCRFTLSQRAGGIYVSGRFLPGSPEAAEPADSSDTATLLLRFHDRMQDAGGIYTRIEEILPGYVLNVSASSMELTPVWRITTDGGVRYLDVCALRLLTVTG